MPERMLSGHRLVWELRADAGGGVSLGEHSGGVSLREHPGGVSQGGSTGGLVERPHGGTAGKPSEGIGGKKSRMFGVGVGLGVGLGLGVLTFGCGLRVQLGKTQASG